MKKLKSWLKKWKVRFFIFISISWLGKIWQRVQQRIVNVYMPWCLFTNCSELNLERFMECMCEGHLHRLRKHYWVTEKMLEWAWRRIIEEYARLSGDVGYERSFVLSKEIARESGKLALVQLCLRVLFTGYSAGCVKKLRELGYGYPFDADNGVGFRRDLERVGRNARMIRVEIERKRREYNKLTGGTGKRPSRDYFLRALAKLSRHMGYRVDPWLISVAEYVIIQKQYEKEMLVAAEGSKAKR